jgi:hypothetical protein
MEIYHFNFKKKEEKRILQQARVILIKIRDTLLCLKNKTIFFFFFIFKKK